MEHHQVLKDFIHIYKRDIDKDTSQLTYEYFSALAEGCVAGKERLISQT